MAKITKQQLEQHGVYAQVTHLRAEDRFGNLVPMSKLREYARTPLPRGGETIARLRSKQTNTIVAVGFARCSKQDQFNKRIGWQIAVGRALAGLGDDAT